MNHRVKIIPTG